MLTNIIFTPVLIYILTLVTLEDIRTMLIDEVKLRILATTGIIYLLFWGSLNKEIKLLNLIFENSIGAIIIFLGLFLLGIISYELTKVKSLGLGDIKLSAISTIWLGTESALLALTISFILSAIYSLYGKLLKKTDQLSQYPFAPFLSIGITFSWILDKILSGNSI